MARRGPRLTDFSTHPRRRIAPADAAFLLAAALVIASAAGAALRWSAEWRHRGAEAARTLVEAEAAAEKARLLESRRPSGEPTLAAQAQATAEAPPQRVVADLSALLPADVRLQSLGLDYRDRVFLDLRVAARRAEAYDVFLQRLAESKRFGDVVPGAETREGELLASLRMSYRGAAP